jgi:hypothetical protein
MAGFPEKLNISLSYIFSSETKLVNVIRIRHDLVK